MNLCGIEQREVHTAYAYLRCLIASSLSCCLSMAETTELVFIVSEILYALRQRWIIILMGCSWPMSRLHRISLTRTMKHFSDFLIEWSTWNGNFGVRRLRTQESNGVSSHYIICYCNLIVLNYGKHKAASERGYGIFVCSFSIPTSHKSDCDTK